MLGVITWVPLERRDGSDGGLDATVGGAEGGHTGAEVLRARPPAIREEALPQEKGSVAGEMEGNELCMIHFSCWWWQQKNCW